jgi:colicin import membrane protein
LHAAPVAAPNAAVNATLNPAADRDPLLPRPPDGLGRGALLALAVHGLLLLALAAGVSWRRSTPETFSAEIWAALPQQAAPRPTPAPEPPAPQPAAAPAPAVAAPPPAPARSEADIALERQRELQRERERAAEAERQKARERELARQKEREAADRQRREREAALLAQQRELQRKRQAELARQQEEARQAAALERQRQENLRRMMGQAGATGAPTATGSAARDAGPSASYGGRIVAAVKPNIVLTDPLPATLEAEVEVRASPTGTILARRLLRSSGNPVWDDAVLRAIDRTRELPRDTDGRVPSTVVIRFRPE